MQMCTMRCVSHGIISRGISTHAQTLVLAAEPMRELAAASVAAANRITPESCVEGNVQWRRFPDQTPNIFIEEAERISSYGSVAMIAGFDSPGSIFEQLSTLYALPAYGARSLKLILPFYPTATMERVLKEGEVATAHTLATMISATPPCMGSGTLELLTWDLHTLQNRFYFKENVVVRMRSAIPILRAKLRELPDHDQICIGFPDAGAEKRFEASFGGEYPLVVCDKKRLEGGERMIVVRPGGGHKDRHVVIVDDLIQSGGTLRECRNALLSNGAASVSAFSTHGVFPRSSWKQFASADPHTGAGWKHVFITDSVAHMSKEIMEQTKGTDNPFVVLSMADSIAAELVSAN